MRRHRSCVWILLWVLTPFWAEGQPPQDPHSLSICTFNVYKLGAVAPKYISMGDEEDEDGTSSWGIPERIKNLARVLAVGPFDIIALQEVHSGAEGNWALSDLVKELRDAHDLTYKHFMSEYIGEGLIPEAIGFLYNDAKAKPQVLAGTTTLVDNIQIPGRDLVRTQWTAGDFDFIMVSGHLAWGNRSHRDAGYEKVQEILTTPVPSAFSTDPDIIVLGDFNRFGKGYESVKKMTYDPAKYLAPNVTFFDPGFASLREVTVASVQGKGVPGNDPQLVSTTVAHNRYVYDMILMTRDCAEEFSAGADRPTYGEDFGVVVFDEEGCWGYQPGAAVMDHNQLKIAYSDHRPLWMHFRTNAGQSDQAPEPVTYVGTQFGSKFHLPGCWTIKNRETPKTWATREAALAERGPCGVCKP